MDIQHPAMIGRMHNSSRYLLANCNLWFQIDIDEGTVNWTNMPNALNGWLQGSGDGSAAAQPSVRPGPYSFAYFDFLYFVNDNSTVGASGSTMFLQYSLDSGGSWTTIPGTTLAADTLTAQEVVVEIPTAMKETTDVWLRIAGEGGNGTADPVWSSLRGVGGGKINQLDVGSDSELEIPSSFSNVTRKHVDQHMSTAAAIPDGTNRTWTNMPSGLTEYLGSTAHRQDWTGVASRFYCCYLTANMLVAGAASAEIRLQYSLDTGSTWDNIDSEYGDTGSPLNIGAQGARVSSIVLIDQALIDHGPSTIPLVRLVGINGNGTLDPEFLTGVRVHLFRFIPY